jgi:hypothetical protein
MTTHVATHTKISLFYYYTKDLTRSTSSNVTSKVDSQGFLPRDSQPKQIFENIVLNKFGTKVFRML